MNEPQRILHVEDDPDILQIAQLSLEAIGGFTLLQCESGPEALKKAEAFAPDLILLDYMMPEMNGYMTLKALREIPSLANVPAIFMTAKNLAMELDSEIQASVIGSIQKPFDAMGLPEQLLRIWRKSVSE